MKTRKDLEKDTDFAVHQIQAMAFAPVTEQHQWAFKTLESLVYRGKYTEDNLGVLITGQKTKSGVIPTARICATDFMGTEVPMKDGLRWKAVITRGDQKITLICHLGSRTVAHTA